MKYILISNPRSGSYNKKKLDSFKQLMLQHNINVEDMTLKENQWVSDIIKDLPGDEKYCMIFACGDGTINNAVNAIINRIDNENFYISVIPMGTANVFCKELYIRNYKDTVKHILRNQPLNMRLGYVRALDNSKSKYFFLMASAGLDSMAVYYINEKLKSKIGKLAYIVAFFKAFWKSRKVDIFAKIDGNIYKNKITCVLNGKYYGGGFKIGQKAINESGFEVIMIKKFDFIHFNIFSIIKYFLTRKTKNIISIRTNKIELESNNFMSLEIEGDSFCNLPVAIESTGKTLKVL